MIKYIFSQVRKFFIIGVLVFLAGYFAAAQSEQCHQNNIQNQTEVSK